MGGVDRFGRIWFVELEMEGWWCYDLMDLAKVIVAPCLCFLRMICSGGGGSWRLLEK